MGSGETGRGMDGRAGSEGAGSGKQAVKVVIRNT